MGAPWRNTPPRGNGLPVHAREVKRIRRKRMQRQRRRQRERDARKKAHPSNYVEMEMFGEKVRANRVQRAFYGCSWGIAILVTLAFCFLFAWAGSNLLLRVGVIDAIASGIVWLSNLWQE